MADTDNTQEQQKQGGGFPGVIGGVAGAVVGGAGVAHFTGKPKDLAGDIKAANEAVEAAKEAHKTKIDKLKTDEPANVDLHNTYTTTKAGQESAELQYHSALNTKWNEAIKEASPKSMGELRLANLEAQAKVLEKIPATEASPAATKWASAAVKDQIAAVKEAVKKDGFEKLSTAEANAAIESALSSSWAKSEAAAAAPAEVGKLMESVAKKPAVFEAMAKKADAKLVEKIAEETKGLKTEVEVSAQAFDAVKSKWEPIAEKAGGTELKAAQKEASRLASLEALNAEKGFVAALKRPIALMKTGTGKQKLAIGGASVALAALSYAGIKSFRNRDSGKADSYADQVTQDRAADQTTGAAR